MLYIVDGTGPANDTIYAAAMAASHCRALESKYFAFTHYFRGPAIAGGTNIGKVAVTAAEIAAMTNPTFSYINEHWLGMKDSTTNQKDKVLNLIKNEPANGKIYLAGYSRGGATVVSIANALYKQGREVEAMFLFDPVDSDVSLDSTQYIPPNVKQPFMAYRNMDHVHALQAEADKQVAEAGKAGGTAAKNVLAANVIPAIPSFLPINPVNVAKAAQSVIDFGKQSAEAVSAQWQSFRWSNLVARDLMFKLCVKGLLDTSKLKSPWIPRGFDGTHGALGGCVWDEKDYPRAHFFTADVNCAAKTRDWLHACIQQTNLNADAGNK